MNQIIRMTALTALVSVMLGGCIVAPKTVRHQVDQGAVANEARKQRELALKNYHDQNEKLYNAAWPVLKSNVDLCGENVRTSRGFSAGNVYMFNDVDQQQAARDALLMDSYVRIISVAPGSPAETAGLVKGDIVKKLNGKVIPSTKEGMKVLIGITKNATEKELWNIEIEKPDRSIEQIGVKTASVCDYDIKLAESDAVNAYADGKNVILTQGMMRFIESDKELSLVVGHEIAHNIMGHITAKKTNYIVGSLFDLAAAAVGVDTQNAFGKASAGAYSQGFEAEADYVGLYLIAKSGYEIEGSADFWRRMAAIHPGSISTNHGASHPATPERFIAIENSIQEIKSKVANNEPLKFDVKNTTQQ